MKSCGMRRRKIFIGYFQGLSDRNEQIAFFSADFTIDSSLGNEERVGRVIDPASALMSGWHSPRLRDHVRLGGTVHACVTMLVVIAYVE